MNYPRIKNLREDYDLTQTDVAEILHVAQRTYCHYEMGTHNIPVDALYLLSDFYDVSVDYLTGRSDDKKPDTPEEHSRHPYPPAKPPALLVSEAKAEQKRLKKQKRTKK